MANSRSKRRHALGLSVVALGLLATSVVAQQPMTAPPSPTVTGALPSTARAAVPQQIDPIVPPAVVAPVARTRPTAQAVTVASTLPACKPGARLQRKAGACAPIAAAASKTAPAKAGTKIAKPKPTSKRG